MSKENRIMYEKWNSAAMLDQFPITHLKHIAITPVRAIIVQGCRNKKYIKVVGKYI